MPPRRDPDAPGGDPFHHADPDEADDLEHDEDDAPPRPAPARRGRPRAAAPAQPKITERGRREAGLLLARWRVRHGQLPGPDQVDGMLAMLVETHAALHLLTLSGPDAVAAAADEGAALLERLPPAAPATRVPAAPMQSSSLLDGTKVERVAGAAPVKKKRQSNSRAPLR